MTTVLQIISGGVLTTVQDAGRPAAGRIGVPTGGAMDRFACAVANRLLANHPGAAVLEVTAGGAAFLLRSTAVLAITGADLSATCNGVPCPLWQGFLVRPGDELRFGVRTGPWGARAYLAVAGGFDLPLVLGSRSTHLSGGFGGLGGRALRPGDCLEAGNAAPTLLAGACWPAAQRPAYRPQPVLRFLPGPSTACFGDVDLHTPFRISATSNRMGYRLEGAAIPFRHPCSLPSFGVVPGAIQVPPDGAPILLMADAQTTGGYPLLGVVCAADLPLAAQLLPGDSLLLQQVSEQDSLAARREQAAWLAGPPAHDDAPLLLGLAGSPG